jgi:hypothetical protein
MARTSFAEKKQKKKKRKKKSRLKQYVSLRSKGDIISVGYIKSILK